MSARKQKRDVEQASRAGSKRSTRVDASQPAEDKAAARSASEMNQPGRRIPDRTGGQNGAVDEKRNDEQQYHAAGTAHDPHNRSQERIDQGNPDAGDVDQETREQSAPFNKTYGHHP